MESTLGYSDRCYENGILIEEMFRRALFPHKVHHSGRLFYADFSERIFGNTQEYTR